MRSPYLLPISRRVSRGRKEPQYALSFDGVDDYVDLGVSRIEYPGGSVGLFAGLDEQWTLEFEVLVNPGGNQTIIAKSLTFAESSQCLRFGTHPSNSYMRITVRGSGTNMGVLRSKDGKWRKYAVVHTGEDTGGVVTIWEPGIRSATKTIGSLSDSDTNILIGCTVPGTAHLDGMVRNVRIWNRVLSLSEMLYYRNVRLKGDEPGLLAYWPMDEGQGDVCYDHGPYGHHALIHGATWVEV